MRGIFDLDSKKSRVTELEGASANPDFWNNTQTAQATLKELSALKKWTDNYDRLARELEDSETLLELTNPVEGSTDAGELEKSVAELGTAIDKFEFDAILSGPDDFRDAILTIHPGAGGTESQDWAEMLFRMYNRWAERKGFSVELLDYQPGEEAGLKSATLEIKGEYAYGYIKAESGVHRLVRISPFDSNARRHTSFVSVHTYPVVEDSADIEIKDEDIRIDTYRASGAGGQHVNRTESAIRITHMPSGIVVTCQTERSQHKNKDTAFLVLKSRLYQRRKDEEAAKRATVDKTKKKIEWGSQIRSYVFHPYNMVKDHRTDVETGNVQAVMDGEIDQFIQAFLQDPELNDVRT